MAIFGDRTNFHPQPVGATVSDWREFGRSGGAGGEIAQSLRLLRHTNQQVSLYRLSFVGIDAESAEWLARAEFGEDGLLERLDDGSLALMIFRGTESDHELGVAVARRLRRTLRQYGVASLAYVELSGIHRCAAVVADLEELLAELSCQDAWLVHGTQA